MNIETILPSDLDIIYCTTVGSKLFGTNTPNSDTDIKGVYVPSLKECITGNFKKSISIHSNKSNVRNNADDIDMELYSIQYYLKLLQKGDTGAIDLLHAHTNLKNATYVTTPIWDLILNQRSKFYTKGLQSFMGYCQKQASKYGIKGSRLNTCRQVIKFLKNKEGRLSDYALPELTHTALFVTGGIPVYTIIGKKYQVTAKCDYVLKSLTSFYDKYGERAELAAKNKGIDWKAISHAFRAAYQLRQIYTTNNLIFPLPEVEFLKQVKRGEVPYNTASKQLTQLIDEVTELADDCDFPESVPDEFINNILYSIYEL